MISNFNTDISRYYQEFYGEDAYSTTVTTDLYLSKDYINSDNEKEIYKDLFNYFQVVFYTNGELYSTEKVELILDTSSLNKWGLLPFRIYTALIDDIQAYCNETTYMYSWAASATNRLITYYGNIYKATYESVGFKDTITITATQHNLIEIENKDPTCTEGGWVTTWSCHGCGKLFLDADGIQEIDRNDIFLPPLGHQLEKTDEIEATALEPGIESYWTCDVCGKLFSDAYGMNEIDSPVIIPAYLDGLSVLYLPEDLEVIKEGAFANSSCEAVIIPEGCTAIEENAFAGCSNLQYVKIPATVMSYPESAFEGCNINLIIDWQSN